MGPSDEEFLGDFISHGGSFAGDLFQAQRHLFRTASVTSEMATASEKANAQNLALGEEGLRKLKKDHDRLKKDYDNLKMDYEDDTNRLEEKLKIARDSSKRKEEDARAAVKDMAWKIKADHLAAHRDYRCGCLSHLD